MMTSELVTRTAKGRLLKRLLHSHHDLWHAQQCVDQILVRSLHAATEPFDKRLLECLNTALIVSYWRPFSGNRGAEDVAADLPDRYRRRLSESERKLHQRIKRARDKDHAHSDPESRSIRIEITEVNGVRIATPVGRDPFVPLPLGDVRQLKTIIAKLLAAIVDEQQRIIRTLPPGTVL